MMKMTADGRLPHWFIVRLILLASLACSACCAMPMASAVGPWGWLNGAPKVGKLDYGSGDALEVTGHGPVQLLSLGTGLHRLNESDAKPIHTKTVSDALAKADIDDLMSRLQHGQAALCCGHWQQPPADAFRSRIATALGVTPRHLGDVHLSSESVRLTATVTDSTWGSVVALFLEPEPTRAKLVQGRSLTTVTLQPGEAILVPEGGELLLEEPRSVAWFHLRRSGKSARSLFEYYFVAGVRAHFVAPHDTEKQRRFFRSLTKHPRYWHGFIWSFFGMIVSIFAMWPLLKKALSHLETLIWESPKKDVGMPLWTEHRLPTLLSRGACPDSMAALSEKPGRTSDKAALSETMV